MPALANQVFQSDLVDRLYISESLISLLTFLYEVYKEQTHPIVIRTDDGRQITVVVSLCPGWVIHIFKNIANVFVSLKCMIESSVS